MTTETTAVLLLDAPSLASPADRAGGAKACFPGPSRNPYPAADVLVVARPDQAHQALIRVGSGSPLGDIGIAGNRGKAAPNPPAGVPCATRHSSLRLPKLPPVGLVPPAGLFCEVMG